MIPAALVAPWAGAALMAGSKKCPDTASEACSPAMLRRSGVRAKPSPPVRGNNPFSEWTSGAARSPRRILGSVAGAQSLYGNRTAESQQFCSCRLTSADPFGTFPLLWVRMTRGPPWSPQSASRGASCCVLDTFTTHASAGQIQDCESAAAISPRTRARGCACTRGG